MKVKPSLKLHLEGLLKNMKGFQFIEMLQITVKKKVTAKLDSVNKITEWVYKTANFSCKAKIVTKSMDIENELNASRQEIRNTIGKWISEGSGWTIDRIDNHYINVTTYQPLNESNYVELPKELQNPAKGLINIKNKDDERFRWCHIRHLNPQKTNPQSRQTIY